MSLIHRRRSPRVATRLLAIVLLPMLALAALASVNAWRLRDTADRAGEIGDTIAEVRATVDAELVLGQYLYLHGAQAVGATFGLDPEGTGELLQIDLVAEIERIDVRFEALLRRLSPTDPMAVDARQAVAIVRDIGSLQGRDPIRQLADAVGSGEEGTLDEMAATDRLLQRADGASRIRTFHAIARSSLRAMGALGRQLSWVGLLAGTDDPQAKDAILERYRRFTADYDYATQELATHTGQPDVDRWLRLDARPADMANRAWYADVARKAAATLPEWDPYEVAIVLGKGVQRMTALQELTGEALREAQGAADQVEADARLQLRAGVLLLAALVLLSLLLVLVIARSISRPIRALATAAERVSTGQLADLEVPGGGPPELRRVSRTLAEVVANLRTVESQVGSLAVGELDGDSLSAPVPGRLGELLHATVGRLSRTMSEREELAQRLEHEATHDGLTGLPNRSAVRVALAGALERARRAGTSVGVLFLDLDGFKQVNDTHGHGIGDRVLQVTAERLGAAVRGGDLVARIGGDEFVIVAEPAGDAFTMLALGQRLVEEVSAPITVGSIATRVGASVGVALDLDGEVDPDILLRDADLAAYRAKTSGRGRAELFDDRLRTEVARRLEVERGLRQAIDDDELELFFQPVVNPAGVAHGVEALVRWHRPGVGLVPPGDFIPVAEGSDLIIDLGRWVLHNACEHLARWDHEHELGALTMGVNLSGRHLLSLTCVRDIRDALVATGADPTRLIVEITETVLMADLPLVTDHLEQIRALGVRVAIDDFGTGYTSLTHLRRLPIDVVKVDRSMISADQPNDALVLKLLVDTVRSLGLRLVAEGVETEAQLERVEMLGCDEIQGFLFSRPVPVPDLAAAVRSSARA